MPSRSPRLRHVARVVAEQRAVEHRLAVGERREQQGAVGDALRAGDADRTVGGCVSGCTLWTRSVTPCAVVHWRRAAVRPLQQRTQLGLVAPCDRGAQLLRARR